MDTCTIKKSTNFHKKKIIVLVKKNPSIFYNGHQNKDHFLIWQYFPKIMDFKKKKINDNNLLVRKGVLNHSGFFYINFCLQNSKVIPV